MRVEREHVCQELDGLLDLIGENYRLYPRYVASRASTAARLLAPENPFSNYGDCKGFLAFSGNKIMAHACAIIDKRLPDIGLIGFFESRSEQVFAQSVLRAAISHLAGQGVTLIRGPVDLTTWNGFRLSFPDDEPPFVSEPFSPAYYRAFFINAGFSVAQRNISTFHSAEQVGFDNFRVHFERLRDSGFTFEKVDGRQLHKKMPELHKLAVECFAGTWSFVPISMDEFFYSFASASQNIGEILLYMAYDENGEAVGFCLGSNDWDSNRKRAIIKTTAVAPQKRGLNVARALLYCFYQDAIERGTFEFILSTMRDDNEGVWALVPGRRLIYRQYEVFELKLKGANL